MASPGEDEPTPRVYASVEEASRELNLVFPHFFAFPLFELFDASIREAQEQRGASLDPEIGIPRA